MADSNLHDLQNNLDRAKALHVQLHRRLLVTIGDPTTQARLEQELEAVEKQIVRLKKLIADEENSAASNTVRVRDSNGGDTITQHIAKGGTGVGKVDTLNINHYYDGKDKD